MTTDECNKLMNQSSSKTYTKPDKSSLNRINKEAKEIAKDLKLRELIGQHSQSQSFITLKDHKDNFQNYLKCKLTNSLKKEIGVIR